MTGKSHCMDTRQMAKCACTCLVEASLGSGLNVYALELCSPLFRISSAWVTFRGNMVFISCYTLNMLIGF